MECASLLARIDQDAKPLVRLERDGLAQSLALHISIGAPADACVRYVTVQYHMLDHGITVKTCGLRHNDVARRPKVCLFVRLIRPCPARPASGLQEVRSRALGPLAAPMPHESATTAPKTKRFPGSRSAWPASRGPSCPDLIKYYYAARSLPVTRPPQRTARGPAQPPAHPPRPT